MNDFNIQQSLENGFDRLFAYLPQIIGAVLLFIIGYFVALGLRGATRGLLRRLRFDRALHTSPAGTMISRIVDSPARLIARVVFWLVFLGFISLAISVLNVPALNAFMGAVYGYLPHVIAALIIFLVASAVSGAAVAFVRRVMGRSALSRIVATAIPSIVMSVAVFMILSELQIAKDIVNITYTALVGAGALGLALAFGLGGRDVAARLLEQAYDAGQQKTESVKTQVKQASSNAKRAASRSVDNLS